jgi:hypothetical protein
MFGKFGDSERNRTVLYLPRQGSVLPEYYRAIILGDPDGARTHDLRRDRATL